MKLNYYGDRVSLRPEVNSMYFKRNSKQDEATFFAEIGAFISLLMSKGMQASIHDEGVGIVVEWNEDPDWGPDDFGNDRLMWVSSDEQDDILCRRAELAEQIVKEAANGYND